MFSGSFWGSSVLRIGGSFSSMYLITIESLRKSTAETKSLNINSTRVTTFLRYLQI